MVAAEAYANLVGSVGFPIAAFYLMYRMANDAIKENTKAITDLRREITRVYDND